MVELFPVACTVSNNFMIERSRLPDFVTLRHKMHNNSPTVTQLLT